MCETILYCQHPHKMKFFHSPSAMITEVSSDKAKNPLDVYEIPFEIRVK